MKLAIVMLFLALVALPVSLAATSNDYRITQVEVDGIVATAANTVYVERSETAAIEIWFEGIAGNSSVDDVRIKAWIGGYEYGDIQDRTEIFTVEPGVSYRKVLRLDIPEDMEASKDYTLHVEMFDDRDNVEKEYVLRVKEKRHNLMFQDVLFSPSSLDVEAGKMLFATVRIENLGEKKEEDIKVTMKIPELGLSTSTYIDQLTTVEHPDDNRDDETSASTEEMVLKMPENADGSYTLVIEASYDRGNQVIKKEFTVNVRGTTITPEESAQLTVSVDKTSQMIKQGQGIVYQISFSNLGTTARTFKLDVNGEGTWARSRVDPQVLTVRPDGTGEMFVYLTANEDASSGSHIFTVSVMSDNKLVQEINLRADVSDDSKAAASTSDFGSFRKGLEIGFIVLLIILVILGIVLAVRKMGRNDDEEGEGKNYY